MRHRFLPALLILTTSSLLACQGAGVPVAGSAAGSMSSPSARLARPRLRSGPVRMPSVSGTDPAVLGLVKVDDLLWVRPSEAETWAQAIRAPEGAVGSRARHSLRTDHVSLRVDVDPATAARVAGLAEAHVRHLMRRYGDALDLRLPHEPLPVVVHGTRPAFRDALSRAVSGHPGWGAFYASRTGTVHVCVEPAPAGALPLAADVRHEMTHQILDLSTPPAGRARIYQGHHLWLWEGFAAFTEGLGDRAGSDTGRLRRERFATRRSRQEVASLLRLMQLDQASFEGRHYDQAAALVAFLMDDGVPRSRSATLGTLRALLANEAADDEFERRLGQGAYSLELEWRRSVGW